MMTSILVPTSLICSGFTLSCVDNTNIKFYLALYYCGYWKKHAEDYADTPDDDDFYLGANISDL